MTFLIALLALLVGGAAFVLAGDWLQENTKVGARLDRFVQQWTRVEE